MRCGKVHKNRWPKISGYYIGFIVCVSTYVILLPPSCAWCKNYKFLLQNRWVPSKRESTWASPHDSSTPSSPRQRTPSAATPSAPSRSATFFVLSKAGPSIYPERRGYWQLTLQTRSDLCIPRNETVWPRSQFLHSCICERFLYMCRNWERGRAVSCLGMFVSNFWYSVFAVQVATSCRSCWWGGGRVAA